MQSNQMVMYDFLGSYKSTIAEKLRVGFTTTEPKGFLLGIFSNITGEYLTLQVSNSGINKPRDSRVNSYTHSFNIILSEDRIEFIDRISYKIYL